MGHSISEVSIKIGFLHSIISPVYHEHRESVKHQIYDIAAAGKRSCHTVNNDDWRESLSVTNVQPYRRLMQILMLGHQQVPPCEQFKETKLIWALGSQGPLVYSCSLHGTNLYALSGPINTDIRRLMTENMLPDLTNIVSN
ncbi:uncharacterized protein TNCV_1480501 [Trichonephila clavipes]|nr:uncharacterized protein TNCV_1480501 [Trichonephila clavipes]